MRLARFAPLWWTRGYGFPARVFDTIRAVLKPALLACVAACAAIYLLAQIALLALPRPILGTAIPGDVWAERDHALNLLIVRDGVAGLDYGGGRIRLGGHAAPIAQAFLIGNGAEALTVAEDGTARITRLDGRRYRSALDTSELFNFVQSRVWRTYVEPSARRALFAVAQVLPLEIPEEAKGRRGRTFRECDQCPELISIDPGVFLMGSRVSETYRYGREFPRRAVTVERRFALGRFAVTFDEWDACVSDGGCGGYKPADQGWGRGRQPVINVSWEDAQGYVGWLTTKTGRTYRLLSESEFEYAARAGSETAYPWGDQIGRNNANCRGCGSEWDDRQTAPVGSFGANAFGLYDMAGNVREWVQDCYHDNYYGAPTNSSAWRTGDCNRHIVRGGSWTRIQEDLRAASRDDSTASERRPDLGFRVGTTLVP